MIPFRMHCPGCQAKVVVKHQELLGKSLPCPKCKQPIVVPSQGPISQLSAPSTREPSPTFDSTAITKEDYGDWEEVLSSLPQNPLGIDPDQIDWTSADPSNPTAESTIPFQPVDTAPPLPSSASEWQDKSVKKRRQLLLVATIGILSSLMAGIGFFSFLSFMKTDQSGQAFNGQASAEGKDKVVDGSATGGGATNGNDNGSPVAAQNSDPTNATNDQSQIESSLTKDPSSGPPVAGEVNGDPVVIPSTTANTAPDNLSDKQSIAAGTSENANQVASEDVSETAGEGKPKDPTNTEEANEAIYKLPPELARVRDLLNNSRGTVGTDSGFRPPPSVDELDLENLQYPQMDIFHPDAKTLGDWVQLSKLNIPRMSAPNDVSLSMGLEEFGRLTNVGITIDWQSCRALGVDANPLISMKFENKVIAEFINETLATKGLVLELDAKGFPIVRPLPVVDNNRVAGDGMSASWELKEVCVAGFEKETAELLISMCEVKDHCSYANGALIWDESAPLLDKAKVYETLRHLAKINNKPAPAWAGTEQFRQSQFSVDGWKESRNTLARALPDTIVQSESRPAVSVLQGAAKMVDAQIMVDWKSAWWHGLTPAEESIAVWRNRTLAQISKKILVEYALEMIPIDSRTFWITTGRVRQTNLIVVPIKTSTELNMDLVKRTLSKLRPLGSDGLSRFQMRQVPGMDGVYFARVCLPNTNIIMQEEFVSVFGWQ